MARVVLGSYFEASSPAHRLDPRFKLLFCLLFIVAVFVAPSFAGLGLMAAFTVFCCLLTEVPFPVILRSIKPLLFILVFAVFVNILFVSGGTVYWHFHMLTISSEGIYRAVFYPLRMGLLLLGMSLFTLTTSPIDITDAVDAVLRPFSRLGFPSHEIAMMFGIALRFLPVFLDEADKIRKAQESRGADISRGNPIKRLKSLTPLMVPLFASAFRHAENLALAMESRCYRGGQGRSRMYVMKAQPRDFAALALFACVLSAAILMRILL